MSVIDHFIFSVRSEDHKAIEQSFNEINVPLYDMHMHATKTSNYIIPLLACMNTVPVIHCVYRLDPYLFIVTDDDGQTIFDYWIHNMHGTDIASVWTNGANHIFNTYLMINFYLTENSIIHQITNDFYDEDIFVDALFYLLDGYFLKYVTNTNPPSILPSTLNLSEVIFILENTSITLDELVSNGDITDIVLRQISAPYLFWSINESLEGHDLYDYELMTIVNKYIG